MTIFFDNGKGQGTRLTLRVYESRRLRYFHPGVCGEEAGGVKDFWPDIQKTFSAPGVYLKFQDISFCELPG